MKCAIDFKNRLKLAYQVYSFSKMKLCLELLLLLFIDYSSAIDKHVLTTEVFEFAVTPTVFNWTSETLDQFVYGATLLDSPDLPSWIYFVHSHKNNVAYLYGVPPKVNDKVSLKIVALNKRDYETKVERLNLITSHKLNPARFEVKLKVDNMNVQDVFDTDRMDILKGIFKKHLWRESDKDLYLTFLNSAIEMGSRKPLNPNEKEGVVLKLGSSAPFSVELRELQEEVRPLYKVPLCPRHYKKTSVERYFREAGFELDWCSFRLFHRDEDSSVNHQCDFNERPTFDSVILDDEWQPISKSEIPERSYVNDLLVTILLPILGITLLALMLSFILCFHDNMVEVSSTPPEEFVSRLAQDLTLPVEPILNGNIACNGTATVSRGIQCRPNPPPYVRPKFKNNPK